MNQAYQVKIDAFEGPLDLLLHLINQYEIDIYDIPVAEITQQYMNYIHAMKQLELNVASEYLVMAATLLAIKSQMLLPQQEVYDENDTYIEDPREELMNRLIEYRKYKNAAEELKNKELSANQIYTRPPTIFEELQSKNEMVRGDISIYDMLAALTKVFERKMWDKPLDSKVAQIEIPIEERMDEIIQIVTEANTGVLFDDLFIYESRSHVVTTFIALLELMKKNEIYCEQGGHLASLYLFKHREA